MKGKPETSLPLTDCDNAPLFYSLIRPHDFIMDSGFYRRIHAYCFLSKQEVVYSYDIKHVMSYSSKLFSKSRMHIFYNKKRNSSIFGKSTLTFGARGCVFGACQATCMPN